MQIVKKNTIKGFRQCTMIDNVVLVNLPKEKRKSNYRSSLPFKYAHLYFLMNRYLEILKIPENSVNIANSIPGNYGLIEAFIIS